MRPLLWIAIVLSVVSGCSSSTESDSQSKSGQLNANRPADWLVGTWYGRGQINPDKLQQKLNSITDLTQRESIRRMSETFQTVQIAAKFTANGKMEMDVEVRPPGAQIQRESTTGQFTVVGETLDTVLIETTEQLPTGGTQTNQVEYRFQDDGKLAVMSAPTSVELSDCDPLFVFQRVDDPDAQVAEQNTDSTRK